MSLSSPHRLYYSHSTTTASLILTFHSSLRRLFYPYWTRRAMSDPIIPSIHPHPGHQLTFEIRRHHRRVWGTSNRDRCVSEGDLQKRRATSSCASFVDCRRCCGRFVSTLRKRPYCCRSSHPLLTSSTI